MCADKKRISIHDYPEHLNPFSENHLTVQDRRQIIADKLRTCKNRTWSSKISKRVSRSVSWLEKSLYELTTDESPKKTRESQICNEKHEIEYPTHPSPVSRLSKTDAPFEVESKNNSRNEIPQILLDQNDERNVHHVTKTEVKKRKKRPAPLPPASDNSSSCSKSEDTDSNKHQIESEDNSHSDDTDVVKVNTTITTNAETSSNPFDEEIMETCLSDSIEEPVPVVNDDDLSTVEIVEHDMQNLAISEPVESENNAEEAMQHSEDDHKVSEIPSSIQEDNKRDTNEPPSTTNDVTCNETKSNDDVKNDTEQPPITPRRRVHTLDENGNVPCVKSKPRRDDLLSEMRCNGKAVMV